MAERTPLEELKLYLGVELTLMKDISDKNKVEGILERTIRALEAGATAQQIKEVFGEYISAWHPDRTYG